MVASFKKHFATELQTLEYCINRYPYHEIKARNIQSIINQVIGLDQKARILEIGAAQGSLLIALSRLGYDCEGVEPCKNAIEVSRQMSKVMNTPVRIKYGFGEDLPYDDESFDCVVAHYSMEHVSDAAAVCREVWRVLKPGGSFYFATTNSCCPYQGEIRFFPFFAWYPDKVKVRIMNWAKEKHPSLVGYTENPALFWYTPKKVTKLLRDVNFGKIFDTWDVFLPPNNTESSYNRYMVILRIIKLNALTKKLAEIFLPLGLHCIAIKPTAVMVPAGHPGSTEISMKTFRQILPGE